MAQEKMADNVVEAVEKRNRELPKTGIVEVTTR
jgi:ATP-binding protein involved in chromosome partitioning